MRIKGCSISIRYKKIENLKQKFYQVNERLKNHFFEASVLPVPDEGPFDIPRIIAKSTEDAGQLSISLNNISLSIAFNEALEKDWNKCREYLDSKMKIFLDFLKGFGDEKIEYAGVVTNVLFEEYNCNATKELAGNLLQGDDYSKLYDLSVRYTFVEDNQYYINIQLQNNRFFSNNPNLDQAGAFNDKNLSGEGITAIIDINDRYSFNVNDSYKSNLDVVDIIEAKLENVLNSKLINLVEKGVY